MLVTNSFSFCFFGMIINSIFLKFCFATYWNFVDKSFSISTLNVSFTALWPACFLIRYCLLMLLKITCRWWITFLFLLSRFSFSLCCNSSTVKCLGSGWVYLFWKLFRFFFFMCRLNFKHEIWGFICHCFLKYFLCPFLVDLSETSIMNMLVYLMVSLRSQTIFLHSLFLLFLKLDILNCLTFEFTNSFLY